jgi:hypothetical protein
MKYRNRLPVATLLGMPALFIGVILAVLSGIALRTGDRSIIPIAGLAASLLVVASAITLSDLGTDPPHSSFSVF